ncbi:MAG: APC family permease [Pyrinomonadaceae bacterium]
MKRLHQPQLERQLGWIDATMIVIGSMIGSGIFLTSAESSRLVGSPGWLLIAWIMAGVMTITGALCCAELAAMMPRAGGQYIFLREAYHPAIGFLFGWSLLLVVQTGTIAAVAFAFANFSGVFAPIISPNIYLINPMQIGGYAISLSTQQLIAILLILLLTATNTRGLQIGRLIQNLLTFIKTAALAGIIILGLTLGWNGASAVYTSHWWNPLANGWNPHILQPGLASTGTLALVMLVGRAMVGPLFAQSAWNNVTFMGSEVQNPGRNLPRALLIGCGVVVLLYVLANLAYVGTLSLNELQTVPQNRVATAVMEKIFGQAGAFAIALAIMISTFGCNNGLILAGARVYYAMAQDNLFFKIAKSLNTHRTPSIALYVQGIWASLLVLPRTIITDPQTGTTTYGNVYTQLLEYIVAADLIFYALMVGAVIILRHRMPKTMRGYKTFGYPVVPFIYIVMATFLIVDLIYLAPLTAGIGFLMVLTGIPIYITWKNRLKLQPAFEENPRAHLP